MKRLCKDINLKQNSIFNSIVFPYQKVLTWRVDKYTQDLPRFMTSYIIRKAFQKWSTWAPLDFVETPFGKVDISIKFLRKSHEPCKVPFDGKDGSIAHAYYPYQGQGLSKILYKNLVFFKEYSKHLSCLDLEVRQNHYLKQKQI